MALTLEEVDQYPVPQLLVPRIAKLHKIPTTFAEGLLREAKRMLYLAAIQDEPVAPSDRVDWAWHEMLMCTRFYKEFALAIDAFIHHDPNPLPEGDEKEETWESINRTLGIRREGTAAYNQTKKNYEKYFGKKPDPLYWP
jgi:hypothetical protein